MRSWIAVGRKCCTVVRKWQRPAAIAAGAAIALGGLGLSTQAQGPAVPHVSLGPLVQISGSSPLRDCTADDLPGQEREGSINYPDSEIEPYIDVNPRRPRNLVAGWQQDRWSDGGARGLVSAVSEDGGDTWKTVKPPKFTLCTGGRFERASDPWVSFARNGDVYFMSLSLNFDPTVFSAGSAMQVSKSTDGGHTWGPPVTLIEDTDPTVLDDKNSMTADPTSAVRAYAIWDRLQVFGGSAPELAALAAETGGPDKVIMAGRALRAMQAQAAVQQTEPIGFIGPTYFTRTINGGATWERPHIIYDPGGNNQTINNMIEVQPDGTLIAFFTELRNDPTPEINLALKRSTDHGVTFLPADGVIRAQQISSQGTVTPDDHEAVRDASVLFDSAVDHRKGTLYLAWQDNRFSGGVIDEIAFSMSRDGGKTWTAPIKVNQTPSLANVMRQAAFVPTVAVNEDGVVAVTYYDFRRDDSTPGREMTDQFVVFCNPARSNCAKAESWGRERRLTHDSFNML